MGQDERPDRRLSHVLIELQLYRVSLSRHYVGRSRNASRVELCPNRRLWRCRRITWRSGGGGVAAFYRRSRPLMFAYDTYSGTNSHLTPFVRIDSNAISLNLGSSAVARKLEVGMLLHLRIKIRVLRNDIAKNLSCKLQ